MKEIEDRLERSSTWVAYSSFGGWPLNALAFYLLDQEKGVFYDIRFAT